MLLSMNIKIKKNSSEIVIFHYKNSFISSDKLRKYFNTIKEYT